MQAEVLAEVVVAVEVVEPVQVVSAIMVPQEPIFEVVVEVVH